ncbi:MAG: hypothetical protein ABR581_10650 [Thermoleophilaceae bacterium]
MGARRDLTAAVAVAGTLAVALVGVGCGSGGGGDGGAEKPPPVAQPEDFPKPHGQTLDQLRRRYGLGGPVLARSVSQVTTGWDRVGFGLFDRARAQIAAAPVALYVAREGGGAARGPFPARYESLRVEPRFLSRSVSTDPDAARSVYVARTRFPRPGRYEVLGLLRLDQRLVAATAADPPLEVVKRSAVPEVGDRAPVVHTPTATDVGGDLSKIDTREPHDSMHDTDFADVVGKKPVILLFATPQLCQSRVCGPVVDIAEQVKAEHPGKAAFIHMEIYNDNQVNNGFRPQVVRWHLPTEPWVFAIDRRGRVAARMEGAFSVGELERALATASRR